MDMAVTAPFARFEWMIAWRYLRARRAEGALDAAETEAMRTRAGMVEIKDGAFLGIMGMGAAGTLASSVLAGTIETVWG